MIDIEETGTIDWIVIEFPKGKQLDGTLVPPLLELVDRHLIRILDAVLLLKGADGSVDMITTNELGPEQLEALGDLAGASSGLIDDGDATELANALEGEGVGLAIVYENLWSLPFARQVRRAGGQLVGSGRIPVQAILARLDTLESEEGAN